MIKLEFFLAWWELVGRAGTVSQSNKLGRHASPILAVCFNNMLELLQFLCKLVLTFCIQSLIC